MNDVKHEQGPVTRAQNAEKQVKEATFYLDQLVKALCPIVTETLRDPDIEDKEWDSMEDAFKDAVAYLPPETKVIEIETKE